MCHMVGHLYSQVSGKEIKKGPLKEDIFMILIDYWVQALGKTLKVFQKNWSANVICNKAPCHMVSSSSILFWKARLVNLSQGVFGKKKNIF